MNPVTAFARARARAHAWTLIEAAPAGFPWLEVARKSLDGWLVIDLDGTLVCGDLPTACAIAPF